MTPTLRAQIEQAADRALEGAQIVKHLRPWLVQFGVACAALAQQETRQQDATGIAYLGEHRPASPDQGWNAGYSAAIVDALAVLKGLAADPSRPQEAP